MRRVNQSRILLLSAIFLLQAGSVLAGPDDPYDYPTSSSPCQVYVEESPLASNSVLRSYLTEKELLSSARRIKAPQGASADLWYQDWEMDTLDGESYGTHLTYTRGDRHNFTATVPLYKVSPDQGEDATSFGLDGAYRFTLNHIFALGGHVNYIYDSWSGDIESNASTSLGPYASAGFTLTDWLTLSAVVSYDYTSLSESDRNDSFSELIPGANIGLSFLDSLTLNIFGLYHAMFGLDDDQDDSYYDAGVQLGWTAGTWGLAVTAKKTFDLDGYEVTEYHLGSVFRW